MKWIVGLGNPGPQYTETRHNIGFKVVDALAERWDIKVTQTKCRALIGEGRMGSEKVYLIKPMTFMNLSGESMRAFMNYFNARLEDVIVVYDDMDTETGKIRLRYQGGPGGHNGIKSIIQNMGTQNFNRIRMGVSRPTNGMVIADYVLSNFPKSEREAVQAMIDKACDAAEHALQHPFDDTMGKFNG
ncbi:peptidyl-tRNA hydrolase, PTH1 family [Paenibacillaceae bacterium GAS479]|nr:peptidyl-tRNA hydrolase, PTH1 family [Paenibacillaceae bacterium GAS479]